jgi:hypothetical protein
MMRPYWAFFLLAACASTPGPPAANEDVRVVMGPESMINLTRERFSHVAQLSGSREEVWHALVAVHEQIGIPFEGGDPKAGTMTFIARDKARRIAGRPGSALLDCGSTNAGERADGYRLTVKVDHTLEEASPGRITLSTSVDASARNPGLSSAAVNCRSRGTLEKQIADLVATRLQ